MEQKATHTPGPWVHTQTGDDSHVITTAAPDGCIPYTIATTYNHACDTMEQHSANARLIAAAPDSHEANISVLADIEYALNWIRAERKKIEARCKHHNVTGAHRDCDLEYMNVAETNLLNACGKLNKAIAKARGEG